MVKTLVTVAERKVTTDQETTFTFMVKVKVVVVFPVVLLFYQMMKKSGEVLKVVKNKRSMK
jgi:type III secretory pathway component EscS